MEYTYSFSLPNRWHNTRFYTTFETEQPCEFIIPDGLLIDKRIREHGYPLKGSGYACGVCYLNGKTYIDFIITSSYLAHIRVECDKTGNYIPNGDIILPPSWDTEEKRERAILKLCKFIKGEPLMVKTPEPIQLNIFDFINP